MSKADIEHTLVGKGIVLRNLATGIASHWEFRPDGRVDFGNLSGPGARPACGPSAPTDDVRRDDLANRLPLRVQEGQRVGECELQRTGCPAGVPDPV